ncbi:2-keto-4-pentenoate hydratase [Nocardia rhizosphaerihabitans]|uniref:2-keto-4-pentenoate hydratase n=1 Tax=Nocardia rhizosphaerihabitans TaxID=1691570 RepID=A0ABQ2L436_9NOCA|nr:2-keto-4-pentenoate hydratase [Nocardia rhizosphaerihabitans]GGN99951.1 2-keto-4-pentenoate hydratase [Nocardia rhizosphaerihabitans]
MSTEVRQQAANALLTAYQGWSIEPLSEQIPDLDLTDAYAIQLAQVKYWTERGATVKGHKVGLTAAAIQRQLGVDQPDYGHLLDTMFHLEDQPIDLARFQQPRIEPEIAFVLGAPLRGPGVTAAEAAAAVQYIVPALEIIDSRIQDWKITLIDTVADNASSGGVVLGSTYGEPFATDLRLTGCVLRHNGKIIDTGAGAAVSGSPLNSLVWLANTVGPLGVTLEAGHVVLAGSLTAAYPIADGDTFSAEFGGIGTVTATFGKDLS